MVTLWIMLLTSCVSNTVYKTVVPDVDFPQFPLADLISNNGDGTCAVSSEWIVNIAEFSIRYSECENNYKEIKELYENN